MASAVVAFVATFVPTWTTTPAFAKGTGTKGAKTTLRERVGAQKVLIEDPGRLAKTVEKLRAAGEGQGSVRVLHLGDSHIAADYITGTIREGLQRKYGDGGRGFTVVDQNIGYGGRALGTPRGFERDRIVDKDRAGLPFGFSGVSLESKVKGARAAFALESDEPIVRLYYLGLPNGAVLDVLVDGKKIGSVDTQRPAQESLVETFQIPGAKKAAGRKAKKGRRRELALVAQGPGARIFGLAFETGEKGVIYEAIGPLGADAKVYLELETKSFTQQLTQASPDLVVLMVGGNDALKIRKGWTDLAKVRRDHEQLLDLLKTTLPNAECLVWSPMDAGDKEGKKVISKAVLPEIRAMQREVAQAKGCAFWDLYAAMGGEGSIARWVDAKVMNEDLVHPREKAAELLGTLFLEATEDLMAAPR